MVDLNEADGMEETFVNSDDDSQDSADYDLDITVVFTKSYVAEIIESIGEHQVLD